MSAGGAAASDPPKPGSDSWSIYRRLLRYARPYRGVFMIGVVLSLAGLLVPIPLMALELLTGAVQAYIFTVLAMVFIGAALADSAEKPTAKQGTS